MEVPDLLDSVEDFLNSNNEFLKVRENYEGYKEDIKLLNKILPEVPDLASFKVSYEVFFIRKFIIICANSFELHLVKNLAETLCEDQPLLSNFIKNQALERRYHQLFSWNVSNANTFFKLFGDDFKNSISQEIDMNSDLQNGQTEFMRLGRTRNEIVHQGFDSVNIPFTVDDTWSNFLKAINFYKFTWEFIKASRSLHQTACVPSGTHPTYES